MQHVEISELTLFVETEKKGGPKSGYLNQWHVWQWQPNTQNECRSGFCEKLSKFW